MIRVVKLSFKEQHIDEFKQFFESRKERIRNAEGCTHLELWQDNSSPGIFYTYSLWEEVQYLEQYRTSALFHDTWSIVRQWFGEKPEAFSTTKLTTA